MSRTYATGTGTFTIDADASPLVHAFQAARLAVIAEVAARLGGEKVSVARPAPGMLVVTAHEEQMAAVVAEPEEAQVFCPLVLDVVTDDEESVQDFAEYLRDRTDNVVVVARQAGADPAS